jgi:hypothetical protein
LKSDNGEACPEREGVTDPEEEWSTTKGAAAERERSGAVSRVGENAEDGRSNARDYFEYYYTLIG